MAEATAEAGRGPRPGLLRSNIRGANRVREVLLLMCAS